MTFNQTRGFDAVFRCIVRHVEGYASDLRLNMPRDARIRACAKALDSMTDVTPDERSNAIKAARHDGYLTYEEVERLSLQEQT